MVGAALCVLSACLVPGCIVARQNPAATRPATLDEPVESARSPYWFAQPPVAEVTCGDFYALWDAARRAALDASFSIDRRDYRGGVMTTAPLVSKQFYELWHNDVVDPHSLLLSSLATVRRLVRFEITRRPDGAYVLAPKVVVERYSAAERRITSVTEYLNIFNYTQHLVELTTDEGNPLPLEYWFAMGRDPALEKHLAEEIRKNLPKGACE
jgi:hypothetical protein